MTRRRHACGMGGCRGRGRTGQPRGLAPASSPCKSHKVLQVLNHKNRGETPSLIAGPKQTRKSPGTGRAQGPAWRAAPGSVTGSAPRRRPPPWKHAGTHRGRIGSGEIPRLSRRGRPSKRPPCSVGAPGERAHSRRTCSGAAAGTWLEGRPLMPLCPCVSNFLVCKSKRHRSVAARTLLSGPFASPTRPNPTR